MKIAIIGGGIFGITTAIKLSHEHDVFLYEKNDDILKSASDVNQCRLHRGYHYPRSDETTTEVLKSQESFLEEYSNDAVINSDNYYCVSKNDSLVASDEYIEFCQRNNLQFKKTNLDLLDKNSITCA